MPVPLRKDRSVSDPKVGVSVVRNREVNVKPPSHCETILQLQTLMNQMHE